MRGNLCKKNRAGCTATTGRKTPRARGRAAICRQTGRPRGPGAGNGTVRVQRVARSRAPPQNTAAEAKRPVRNCGISKAKSFELAVTPWEPTRLTFYAFTRGVDGTLEASTLAQPPQTRPPATGSQPNRLTSLQCAQLCRQKARSKSWRSRAGGWAEVTHSIAALDP